VEEDVEEHQDTNIACVADTGQKMDRAQDATLTNRGPRQSERGTRVMACATRRPRYSWGSGRRAASQRRCLSPQRGTSAQPRRVLDKTRQVPTLYFYTRNLCVSAQIGSWWWPLGLVVGGGPASPATRHVSQPAEIPRRRTQPTGPKPGGFLA
jgi:hypothetical protein